MSAYTPVAGSRKALVDSVNAGSDQWAAALSNVAPSSTTFTAGTSDLPTGSGYTAGGENVLTTSANEVAGVLSLILGNPATWNFTGSVTFRYVLLVDKTVNIIMGYWDYGTAITTNSGDTMAVTLDGTNGVFEVA